MVVADGLRRFCDSDTTCPFVASFLPKYSASGRTWILTFSLVEISVGFRSLLQLQSGYGSCTISGVATG